MPVPSHDHSNPGTVHKIRSSKIKDHIFDMLLLDHLIRLPFDLLRIVMIHLRRKKNRKTIFFDLILHFCLNPFLSFLFIQIRQ